MQEDFLLKRSDFHPEGFVLLMQEHPVPRAWLFQPLGLLEPDALNALIQTRIAQLGGAHDAAAIAAHAGQAPAGEVATLYREFLAACAHPCREAAFQLIAAGSETADADSDDLPWVIPGPWFQALREFPRYRAAEHETPRWPRGTLVLAAERPEAEFELYQAESGENLWCLELVEGDPQAFEGAFILGQDNISLGVLEAGCAKFPKPSDRFVLFLQHGEPVPLTLKEEA